MSDTIRLSVLNSLLQLRYKDPELLDQTCDLVVKDKIRNIHTITNILNLLLRFRYTPKTTTQTSLKPLSAGTILKVADS